MQTKLLKRNANVRVRCGVTDNRSFIKCIRDKV